MPLTEQQMARRIMLEQGSLQSGEQPSHEEYVDIRDVMRSVHAEMLDNGLIDWPLSSIPARCEDAWIKFMAGQTANLFGLSDMDLIGRAEGAYRRLIALSAQPVDSRDIPVCDF